MRQNSELTNRSNAFRKQALLLVRALDSKCMSSRAATSFVLKEDTTPSVLKFKVKGALQHQIKQTCPSLHWKPSCYALYEDVLQILYHCIVESGNSNYYTSSAFCFTAYSTSSAQPEKHLCPVKLQGFEALIQTWCALWQGRFQLLKNDVDQRFYYTWGLLQADQLTSESHATVTQPALKLRSALRPCTWQVRVPQLKPHST